MKVLFEQGYQVSCLVRENSNRTKLQRYSPDFRVGDVSNVDSLRKAFNGMDVVFHLAGITKSNRMSTLMRVNETGSENVARACDDQPTPPVLVVASSLAAAGPSKPGIPRTETDKLSPVSNYGLSKLAGELAVRKFSDRVPTSIVRPPIVFGEGDRDCYNLFRGIAKCGVHLIPSLADHQFSAIHARDLCLAMQVISESGKRLNQVDSSQGGYFVADEQVVTYADLGKLIAKVVERDRIWNLRIPTPLLMAFAAFNEIIGQIRGEARIVNLDKTREARAGSWACSANRLKLDTGFRCVRSLEPRLRQTAEWYERQGWLPTRGSVLQCSP